MIALDTETTGKDLYHGASAFFVTTCRLGEDPRFFEWDVDPYTRHPIIPAEDLEELAQIIQPVDLAGTEFVLHNAKFDVTALAAINPLYGELWNWKGTHDTLLAAHLLGSNRPKDLTSLAVTWLGTNIEPQELELAEAVKDCRRIVGRRDFVDDYGEWAVAKEGRPDMPSAKEATWAYDFWLPRAVAKWTNLPENHPYWTVLRDYSNADSVVTIHLHHVLQEELKRRGLVELYECRRKLLKIVYEMEARGVTVNQARHAEQIEEFTESSTRAGAVCTNIAAAYGHELELPKNGVNNNLRTFCFDILKLPPVVNPKSKTSAPSLDAKNAIPYYLETLGASSKERKFIENLADKRKYDTALSYLESYTKFWLPLARDLTKQEREANPMKGWYLLHYWLNITGSDTLRFSSSYPNTQQISKQEKTNLRRCFGPRPGREWYSNDAKNIELRLPAYKCGEKSLIDLFERSSEPPFYGSEHLLNFSVVYPDIWEDAVNKVGIDKAGPWVKKTYASSWYQRCKNGDFAVGYGAIDRPDGLGTADRTFGRPGSHARLKAQFAKKEALNQHYIQFARKHGYVETFPDKTVNPNKGYPLLCTRTEHGRILETVPLNYAIQGSAMWWMCKAMIRVSDFFEKINDGEQFAGKHWPGGYYIVLQVHDELVTDMPRPEGTPDDHNMPIVREVCRLMELGGTEDYGIPTPVGCERHSENWAEGVSICLA